MLLLMKRNTKPTRIALNRSTLSFVAGARGAQRLNVADLRAGMSDAEIKAITLAVGELALSGGTLGQVCTAVDNAMGRLFSVLDPAAALGWRVWAACGGGNAECRDSVAA